MAFSSTYCEDTADHIHHSPRLPSIQSFPSGTVFGMVTNIHPCRLGSVSSDKHRFWRSFHGIFHCQNYKHNEAQPHDESEVPTKMLHFGTRKRPQHLGSWIPTIPPPSPRVPQVRHGNVHGPPVHSHVFMVVARCPHRFAHDRLVRHGGFADHFTQEHDLATKMASGHP